MASDFHFQYPIRNNPLLAELQQVSGVKTDPTKDVIGYAHNLFAHDGDNTPSANDPLTILKEAQAGKSFRCVEYSTLAAGLLWANGIPARTVGLKTRDVETRKYGAGHVVIEFWDNGLKKWVMSDVQAGVIPLYENTPLSAYELKQHLDSGDPITYASVTNSRFQPGKHDDKPSYSDWIKEYLYFIDTPASLTLGNEDKQKQKIVMLIPSGTQPPKTFQGLFKMNAVYTTKPEDFYPDLD
ncbi:MAG TPA: transglutaminase-like domain-containing protein [Candidatus Saccharimonadales bacterium]|nr:transglutaminase-like domain-containing protein [Candidatus Saccharimonadales bacterium]